MLKVTKVSAGGRKIRNRRAARINRFCNDGIDRGGQPRGARAGNAGGFALWRNVRAIKGFTHIDVAETCDDGLVKQRGFNRRRAAREGFIKIGSGEAIGERFWPHFSEAGIAVEGGGGPQLHKAEAAGIIIGDAVAALHIEDDMIMFGGGGERIVELAERGIRDGEAARHAQMHNQNITRFEFCGEEFGAPTEPCDACAGQAFGKARRKREAQVWPILDDGQDAATLHSWG